MSSPKAPSQQKVLPLTDPHNVREAFAHELTGIGARKDGTCHLTFSVIRAKHRMPGAMHNDPDEERVVSARLVLPLAAIPQMLESFRQLQMVMASPPDPASQAN